MRHNFKKGDGISIVIIVVVSALLVMSIFKPAIEEMLDSSAESSREIGSQITNVAQNAIEQGGG